MGDIKRRQERLTRDIKKCQAELTVFKDERMSIENMMYERFVPILNAKKQEIKKLRNSVGQSDTQGDDEKEDDYGESTDEDVAEAPALKKTKHEMSDSLDILNDSLTQGGEGLVYRGVRSIRVQTYNI